jgi:hydroxymethylpyrimidine/phosphomethylpyrimidine kinase
MLGSASVAQAVATFLEKECLPNVVLDPVLKSSSGADLLERSGVRVLVERLVPLSTVVTPNLDEAAELTGLPVTNAEEMRAAAVKLHALGAPGVVITGGHLDQAIDLLGFTAAGGAFEFETFKSEKQASTSTHGTGCAFASSLACHLALGRGLPDAVLLAKAYVGAAISNAHPLGKGVGPVHHLFRMTEARRPERSHEPEPHH